ncbi:MAG TPA: nitrogenase [Firmicutes bacterium]|jgi:nitrogenase molybdenum-iron protein alpha chain|nr:nitrogenase [Bacillota bacterium]
MDYIREKTPPVREERLRACNAFGGSCCELTSNAKKGCLNGTKRTFAQSQGCQLTLSLAILNTIRNAVIIIHGPIGCGGSSLAVAGTNKGFMKMWDPAAKGLIWLNTNLDETDVIKGGEAKLREAVLYAEQEFRPEAIIVANSCVPALIGDDLDGILAQLQAEVAAKIMPVHCEGFKTKIQASAYDAVYHGVLRNLVGEREQEQPVIPDALQDLIEKYRISRTVNIMNVSSMSRFDEIELTRIMNALNLKVRYLPCYAKPDDFETVTEAALNISLCATHDDYFVEHLLTRYKIPFILRAIPIGIANTSKWIRDIARFFKIEEEAERFIEAEIRELDTALVPYREVLRGKRVFLAGGEIRVLANASLLEELGLKLVGMKGYHYDRFGDDFLNDLKLDEKMPFNIATGQPFEQTNLLANLKPDLYVGHVGGNSWAAKQGLPIFPIFGQSVNYMGYSGVFELARRLVRVLKNPVFNRNLAANTHLPYFEDWYKQDPFTYIDKSALTAQNLISSDQ